MRGRLSHKPILIKQKRVFFVKGTKNLPFQLDKSLLMWHSCGSFLIITVITKEVELMKGKFKTWLNKVLFVQETEEGKKLREQQLRELDELLEEIKTEIGYTPQEND